MKEMSKTKPMSYGLLLLAGAALFGACSFVLSREEMRVLAVVCSGIGAGMLGMGFAHFVTLLVFKRHPEYGRKVMIEEQDERNQAIRSRSKASAFDAMGVIFGVVMLVCALIGTDLKSILLFVFAYLLVYGVYSYNLVKWSKEL
jgi:hypothetical protein